MKRNLQAGIQLNAGLSLNILTDDEVEQIHLGTLEILDQTGIFVEDERALDCFEKGGASVDRGSKVVKIPPLLVEESIRSAPSKVILAGRDPKHDLVLEGTRIHFTNFSEGIMINDPFTKIREMHSPTFQHQIMFRVTPGQYDFGRRGANGLFNKKGWNLHYLAVPIDVCATFFKTV